MKIRLNTLAAVSRHSLINCSIALLLGIGGVLPADAAEVPGLYSAEVLIDEDAKNPRDDAYRAALSEVLGKVSGAELAADFAVIEQLFPEPDAYVTQFRPGEEDTLWVSFDGDAIERVLRNNGQLVWGNDRPLTLVWLAVDWGRGDREIIAAGDPERSQRESRSIDRDRLLRERLLDIAARRGLPIAFPLLDTTDLQSVTFSDIWGGFDDRILSASERYNVNSILVGRVRASSSQRNRWSYFFGSETGSWTGEPETVISQIADMLAAELAVGGNAPVEIVGLNVSGVGTVDAYGAVQKMLNEVSLIERIRISQVQGDTVSYEVEVRGGAARLRRALRFTSLLEQEDNGFGDPGGNNSLEFFYNP
ncbi:MAG: DUF2066 domain-containing protein [Gammaproteobacteria bacterium]|nr:DUF2066 domain-containing protein [Gammaproteobacteria bacterium]